jgi:hypothetical protein
VERASVLYTFIVEDLWTKVGLKAWLKILSIRANFANFCWISFHFHRKFHSRTEVLSVNVFAADCEESRSVVSSWVFKFSVLWVLNVSGWKTVVRFPILLFLLSKLALGLTKSSIRSLPRMFPLGDLPRIVTTVVAFCVVSVLKMI